MDATYEIYLSYVGYNYLEYGIQILIRIVGLQS